MKQHKLISVILILAFSSLPVMLSAQDNRTDLRGRVEKLKREIEAVRELATSFQNDRALQLVAEAENALRTAVEKAEAGRFAEALTHLRIAETKVEMAKRLTIELSLKRQRSRLGELLQKAEDVVVGSGNLEAERVLREAVRNRNEGDREATSGRVLKAAEHYRVGTTLVERALQMIRQSGDNLTDRVDDARRRFEDLKERAMRVVDESRDSGARQVLQQALQMASNAERELRGGNFSGARQFYNQSQLLLLRAIDMATDARAVNPGQIETRLYHLRENIDKVSDRFDTSRRPRITLLIDRARRLAREAEAALQQDQPALASWKIELGDNLIRRVERLSRRSINQQRGERLRQEIDDTHNDIADLRGELSPGDDSDASILLKMADFAIKKAEQAMTSGRQRVALEGVLAAQRFLSRAEKVLNLDSTPGYPSEGLEVQFDQLDAAIIDAETRLTGSSREASLQLLRNAREIRDLSFSSYRKGNLRAAEEGIRVSFELIRKSTKNLPRN